MQPKKIWMSADTAQKSRYARRTLGAIAGITLSLVLLAGGGTVLLLTSGLSSGPFLLLLCLALAVLGLWLGLAAGQRSLKDATVFWLTDDDRLYALNAARLSGVRHGLAGYASAAVQTQTWLRELAARPVLPAMADEILRVEHIRENRNHYAVRCEMRHPGGRTSLQTCFVCKGLEEETRLLQELERRRDWRTELEPRENRNPFYLVLSGAALAALAGVCALSHPAVALLPPALYFPCLGGAFLLLFVFVYFLVRQRRGE